MPLYKYLCPDNGVQVEVSHPSEVSLVNWGQLCFVGQLEMGETPFEAPVEKVLVPAQIFVPDSNSKLKENGFTIGDLLISIIVVSLSFLCLFYIDYS